MKILIFGHSGFIGAHILEYFHQIEPNLQIRTVSSSEIDLSRIENLVRVQELLTPETVVIFCSGIKRQYGDNLEIFRKNLAITDTICSALENRSVKKFIFLSSAAVYGEDIHNRQIQEVTPVSLKTYYAIAKYTSECMLRKAIERGIDSNLAVLRPPLVYGKGDVSNGYGPAGFIQAVNNREDITIWGDGSELREFVFVKDLARIVFHIASSEFSGVLNPVSGNSRSYRDLVDIIQTLTKRKLGVVIKDRTRDKVDHVFDNHKLKDAFPDFSFTTLEEGLGSMISV